MKFMRIGLVATLLGSICWQCTRSPAPAESPDELLRGVHVLNESGKYLEALSLVQKIADETGDVIGKHSTQYGWAVDALARQNTLLHRYEIADSLFSVSEPLLQTSNFPDTLLAESYHRHGLTKFMLKDFESARQLFERAFQIDLNTRDSLHPESMWLVENLARVWWAQGRFDRAIPYLERLLNTRSVGGLPTDSAYLATVSELVLCYKSVGRYEATRQLSEKALHALKEKVSECITCENRIREVLGTLYLRQNEWNQARSVLGEAAKLAEESGDTSSLLYFNIANSFGQSLVACSLLVEGSKYLEKALHLSEQLDGYGSIGHVNTAKTLAHYYRRVGNVKRAIELDSIENSD